MKDLPSLILTIVGVIGAVGGLVAFFARSRGLGTISLLEKNIEAYQDSEKLKDQRIAYLEGQLVTKEETIKRLLHDGKNTRN